LTETALTTFEDMIQSEVTDVAWEREAQRTVAEALARPEFTGTRLESVTCAQTLCKILVRHDDSAARAKFIDADGLQVIAFREHSGFSHYDRGARETLVYVARKGQPLPKLTLPWTTPT
jgi:hypothetical protein